MSTGKSWRLNGKKCLLIVGFLALRQFSPIHKKGLYSLFFLSKCFKLNMTKWPCHVWLPKKISMTHQQASPRGVTNFYTPIWVMGFCVLYHQTIIFMGKMVFISDGQPMLWTQKTCRKCIFQRSGDPNSRKSQSLGKNGCRQKCLDKSLITYLLSLHQ